MTRLVPRLNPLLLLVLTVAIALASVPVSLGMEPAFDTVTYGVMAIALGVAGALVRARHPENPIGWFLCAMGVSGALVEVAEGYGKHTGWGFSTSAEWFASWGWLLGAGQYPLLFLLFPTGHLPGRRWRAAVYVAGAGLVLSAVGEAFRPTNDVTFSNGTNPYAIDSIDVTPVFVVGQVMFLVALIAGAASLIVRFGRSTGVERQQLKWVAYPTAAMLLVGPAALTPAYATSIPLQAALAAVVTAIPAAICVAILRYRLYDIDLVINRTLVYGSLTLLLGVAYVATSLLLGTAVGRSSAWASAGGTLAAAAAFRPLRSYLQDKVDRQFNRARHDALHQIDEFLEALRAGDVGPESIETVLGTIAADPGLRLEFTLADTKQRVGADGIETGPATVGDRMPVEQGRAEARAYVIHRPLDPPQEALLASVVNRAGLAIEMSSLRVEIRHQLAEVEASRSRILEAGYAERRRIERDLHDGAQQRLVSIGLALRHAQHQLNGSPASLTIDGAVAELTVAIEDLRALANGVRPSQLDAGLAIALRELAARAPLPVEVSAGPERYSDDLEAAAYFVACEALTNAVKHARATRVVLQVGRERENLVMTVTDDGIGGATPAGGSGLRGLADRVAAHGGRLRLDSAAGDGTILVAELPCAS